MTEPSPPPGNRTPPSAPPRPAQDAFPPYTAPPPPPRPSPARPGPRDQPPALAPPPAGAARPTNPPSPTRGPGRNGLALLSLVFAGLLVCLTVMRIVASMVYSHSTEPGSYPVFLTVQTGLQVLEGLVAITTLALGVPALRRSAPETLRWAAILALGVAGPALVFQVLTLVDTALWYA
ncbi:hypothetical protein [Leucobacter sp. M11]|uniref:hypothetical protein n=1 Tax=Leucobacter sp. M11 TaxID=2993565 RepID=UPI002D7FF83A|nr:hypothetical protein [Leucobacter sp. M11]MEB4613883.1 hypothetical protein [Leucobacter sp. M11]